ncbi:MAG: PD40 domain-containing protein [Planctomycetia bacterium]|nr:PD40 domain-containing protein [Planctomycetia bacterium]
MNLFLQSLLSHVVIAALLAGLVYGVTRIWRNPQLSHALWVLVLLKLITPPLVTLPIPGLVSEADAPGAPIAQTALPLDSPVVGGARAEHSSQAVESRHNAHNAAFDLSGSFVGPAQEAVSGGSPLDWRRTLLAIWAAGSLVLIVVGLRRVRQFSLLISETSPADADVQRDAADLAQKLGLRCSPQVRIVQGAIPPVVWSLGIRPVILLPATLLPQLGRAEQLTILAHELAHIRRGDHWVRWLEALVFVLYWWNPCVWLVRRELNVVEEQCCDLWVVWLVPECRRAYAGAIVQTVEYLSNARAAMPLVASGLGRSFPLKTRITAILAESRTHRLPSPLRLGLAVVAVTGLSLSAVPGHSLARRAAAESVERPAAAAQTLDNGSQQEDDASSAEITKVAAIQTDGEKPGERTTGDKGEKDKAGAPKPALRGRLIARGFWFRSDMLDGKLAIASIDPETGAWKRLVDHADNFSVSPDGQTIAYAVDGALWNGDAATNANPGKIFNEAGHAVFSPDSRSMLVTTWKKKAGAPDDSNEYETTVWRMGIDGTAAVPIADLAGWGSIYDWSSDGRWLLAEKGRAIHLLRPDGKESRQIAKRGEHPKFSPDGQRVAYVKSWEGQIRVIEADGSNDRLVFQAPQMIMMHQARWSENGKHLAAVLMDLTYGNDGTTPILSADPKVSHPRVGIVDVATGEQRTLTLPRQEDWDFYPTGELEWLPAPK